MGLVIANLDKKAKKPEVVIVSREASHIELIRKSLFADRGECFSFVRAVPGYIGTVDGKCIAVIGTGVGDVSAAMYICEIIRDLKPKKVIKVDECFTVGNDVRLGEIIIAQTANTTARMNRYIFDNKVFPAAGDFDLINVAYKYFKERKIKHRIGPMVGINTACEVDIAERFFKHGTLAVDYEVNQIYTSCILAGIPSVAIGVVSEELKTGRCLDNEKVEGVINSIVDMVRDVII